MSKARFSYSEMSSLVLESDRSQLPRRDKEGGSGLVESLWGRIDTKEMGIRASREAAPAGKKGRSEPVLGLKPSAPARKKALLDEEFAGLGYRPKSKETRLVYEYILALVHAVMASDQPEDVVKGATDEVISVMKSEAMPDSEKRTFIQPVIGVIDDDTFAQLSNLTVRITDYEGTRSEREAKPIADEGAGVAMVFQEDDSDEENTVAVVVEEEDNEDDQPAMVEGEQDIAVEGEPAPLDLSSLEFTQGGHTMTNRKCLLPEKSFKRVGKGYEEIHVPAPQPAPMGDDEHLVPIANLPEWMHVAFPQSTVHLNRVQSRVAPRALQADSNLLVCAPTGAGKTNIALLAMLREIGKHRAADGGIALDAFKIVYIAPMKALVHEQTVNFQARLKPLGLCVSELTGDQQLTRAQLRDTQVIVTTPEKWDVVTRKSNDLSYTRLVRLVIVDEIHLLHDDRGPVLEALVARTLRTAEQTQQWIRIVGLSATLPNYGDVARFIRVASKEDVFFFHGSYRPCPLSQQYIGITERKPFRRFQLMNELTWDKVAEQAGQSQVLVFVHSRKDTAKTAGFLRDTAVERQVIGEFLASRDQLAAEAEAVNDGELRALLPFGFAIHHAGLSRSDRLLVERLFRDGLVQVLVATATLAWGVNLPAHRVIIKGTQVYSPERGQWIELSNQDVLQMLGRAGRPQFDTEGEGIIITSHSELQYYLSLMNQQLPIESQMIAQLGDHLNAEIVLGTVKNRMDAVEWLGYSYLFIRMLREPALYGISSDDTDEHLANKRLSLIHAAALALDRGGMIRYDRRTGEMHATDIGRVASHYYVRHASMSVYNEHLRSTMDEIDLFRLFSLSHEFRHIPVRAEEKLEVGKLLERVPIPIKDAPDEPPAKINALLQAHISQLALHGLALVADMVYVRQSASRIWRAIFELCLRRGWARVARKALDCCRMVDQRQWLSVTPLRQLPSTDLSADAIRRVERKDFPWARLRDLNPQELSELFRLPKQARQLYDAIHAFPKVDLAAHILPLSDALLRIELTIKPDFEWNTEYYGRSLSFWVLVEDVDQEEVLFVDQLLLKARYSRDEHYLSITIPLPEAPVVYVSVISDRLLHCQAKLPVPLNKLLRPERTPPCTELVDQPALAGLDAIQTQIRNAVSGTDENVLVAGPTDTLVIALMAVEREFARTHDPHIVYLAPNADLVANAHRRFAALHDCATLTGELQQDLKLLESHRVILSTSAHWDTVSRRWRQRRAVQSISLLIADHLQLLALTDSCSSMEVCVSRMRSMQAESVRFIGLSATSLGSAIEIGDWLGAQHIFNFHSSSRPVELRLQPVSIEHHPSQMIAMTRPAYDIVREASSTAIIVVDSRRQARQTASDMATLFALDGRPEKQLHFTFEEAELMACARFGIGYFHESLSATDKDTLRSAFAQGQLLPLMILSREAVWQWTEQADVLVIMGTQYYDGREHRYVEYPLVEVARMISLTTLCTIFCPARLRRFYAQVLFEPLPIESQLDQHLHDLFTAEVTAKTITSKQDAVDYLTWTLFYRRLSANPSYYGLQSRDMLHISEHLSELVEGTLTDLAKGHCLEVGDDDLTLSPLNLGMIAAYYRVQHRTIEMFALSLNAGSRMRAILEIVCAAGEFEQLPVRLHDDQSIAVLHEQAKIKLDNPQFHDPHTKANVLLQAHFSRVLLPADLRHDLAAGIIPIVLNLLLAMVDVVSSQAWLGTAIAAMEFSQMVVQGMWEGEHPLKQLGFPPIPNINSIFDFIDLPDGQKVDILKSQGCDASFVASFCNRYPAPSISWQSSIDLDQAIPVGTSVRLSFTLCTDYEPDALGVISAAMRHSKLESWWLVVADAENDLLLGIKRVTVSETEVHCTVDFDIPTTPSSGGVWKSGKIYVVCDSFVGADQEFDLPISIANAVHD